MTDLAAFASYLILPLFGLWTWRLATVRRMPLGGRLAVAGAAGVLTTSIVMALMSLLRVEWTRASVLTAFVSIAAANLYAIRGYSFAAERVPPNRWATFGIAVFIIVSAYGALTARETCGDLAYFWGPKAVRFYRAGGIDAGFLRNRDYYPMHPDYPPLVPLVYAWSITLTHRFGWWAAVLTMPLLLGGCAALVRGFSGDAGGALLMTGSLALAIAVGWAAGAGDPVLVFFETLAVCALTFVDDEREQTILAAIGMAGAAWTKIEGTTFVIAAVLAVILLRRQVRRALTMAAPAAILVSAWVIFSAANGVLDMYAAAGRYAIHASVVARAISLTFASASYDVWWLPWIAPLFLIGLGTVRRAALPLAVAALTVGASIFFYVHADQVDWWIAASAPRVLLTPLMAVTVGSIAAWRLGEENKRPSGDGL